MKVSRQRQQQSLRAACAAAVRRSMRRALPVMERCEARTLFVALDEIPALHSLPQAQAKLFLDFNGEAAMNWLGTDVPATPAFDRDGNANDFSTDELAAIDRIWQRVSEKFSPFHIDVTTEDPINRGDRVVCAIVIGGDGAWLGFDAGGVAPLGGFYNRAPNVGFVFSGEGVFTDKAIAEATTHEAGHLFGLEHHSTFTPEGTLDQEYDPGDFFVAPIMGVSYYADRGTWQTAATPAGPNVIQDDLAVLTSNTNGFGYRVDDYGGTQFSAQRVATTDGSNFTYAGVIERPADLDAFLFTATGGNLSLTLDVAPLGPMLDASIRITDVFGTPVGESATVSLGESINISGLLPNTYVIYVSGATLPPQDALRHHNLGQYTLRGSLTGGDIPPTSDHLLIQGTDGDDAIVVSLVEGSYHIDINGEVSIADPNTINQFDILVGDGNDRVTLMPGVARAYVLAGGGDDTVVGSEHADTITGSAGRDIIYGMDGDDRLAGSPGHDILVGMNGRDRLYGDAGNDQLKGGAGVDRLYGGDGHDVLVGESSADKMYGDLGNDTIVGGHGTDLLNGGEGLDFMYGGADNDWFYTRDDGVVDFLYGDDGTDTAEVEEEDVEESIEVRVLPPAPPPP